MEMKISTTLTLEGGVPRAIKVPSSTRPGVKHTVLLHCTCEGFRYGSKCGHILSAAQLLRITRKESF